MVFLRSNGGYWESNGYVLTWFWSRMCFGFEIKFNFMKNDLWRALWYFDFVLDEWFTILNIDGWIWLIEFRVHIFWFRRVNFNVGYDRSGWGRRFPILDLIVIWVMIEAVNVDVLESIVDVRRMIDTVEALDYKRRVFLIFIWRGVRI